MAKARQPGFYDTLGVTDSVDGRFDMIVLHAVLLIERLRVGSREAKDFSQEVFDVMFADMDRSLREMGVGDLSVGKKVRKMGEMFYGRAEAYAEAARSGDRQRLAAAIDRNIFPEGSRAEADDLARYFLRALDHLAHQDEQEILSGRLTFPDKITEGSGA